MTYVLDHPVFACDQTLQRFMTLALPMFCIDVNAYLLTYVQQANYGVQLIPGAGEQ